MSVDPELAKFIEKVNKRYKAPDNSPIIFSAESSPILQIPRLRTGVFSLDLGLGGGFPQGRIVRVYGPPSGGKSLLCLRMVQENQGKCRNCWKAFSEVKKSKCCSKPRRFRTLWLDVEGVWENNWALKHGVDLDQVIVSRTEFAEQGLDIVHSCLLERAVDLVVIDSLAQLSTTKELDSSQEDTKVALNARAVNEFLRKCVADLNSQKIAHKSTVILINQIRYSVGAYGDPETMPGGMGQEFASSVDVRLQRYRVVTDKGKLTGPAADNSTQGVPVGAMTNFRITKNKTSPPHRSGEYCIWFSDDENSGRKVGDVDCSDALFEYGVRCGVLSKEGRSYVFTDLEGTLYTLDTKKDAVKRQIFEDDRLYKSLQEAVLNKLTGSVSSDSDARVL